MSFVHASDLFIVKYMSPWMFLYIMIYMTGGVHSFLFVNTNSRKVDGISNNSEAAFTKEWFVFTWSLEFRYKIEFFLGLKKSNYVEFMKEMW